MPELELLSRVPKGEHRPFPLLFVHGAFSGAWIWDERLLPRFAGLGFSCHAVSLRGHGASPGRERLPWYGLNDYVEDVAEAAARLSAPPVLIGHSMGGMVCQRALRAVRPRALVLLASVPPDGLWDCLVRMTARDPLILQQLSMLQMFGPPAVDMEVLARAMFSAEVPVAELARYRSRFQAESPRVSFDMMMMNPLLTKADAAGVPVLVLGAERDIFVPPDLVHATARAFRTTAIVFSRMAHAMMLEPGWEAVVDVIAYWLDRHVEVPAAKAA